MMHHWKSWTLAAGVLLVGVVSTTSVLSQQGGDCGDRWPERLICFKSSTPARAAEVNANFHQLSRWDVPVGSIVAWHKTLAGGALPAEWTECDGKTLDDPGSPLDGQVIPDLNGERLFLRGSASSGTLEDDAMQGHSHQLNVDGNKIQLLDNVHPRGRYELFQSDHFGCAGCDRGYADEFVLVDPSIGGPTQHSQAHGQPRTAAETRPANMSVVWIMRVR